MKQNTEVAYCCAVEDSVSGVGSASNAKLGLIIGYVGANHIDDKLAQAELLLQGICLSVCMSYYIYIERV